MLYCGFSTEESISSYEHLYYRSSAPVVAGENSVKLDNTVYVGGLNTTAVGAVEAALSVGDTRVYTCGVAVPDVDEHVRDGSAGVDVYELHIEVDRNSWLILGDIGLLRRELAVLFHL